MERPTAHWYTVQTIETEQFALLSLHLRTEAIDA